MSYLVSRRAHIFTGSGFVQSNYLSSIPETTLHRLSQRSDELTAEPFIRPVLSFSNPASLPTEIMDSKEARPSDYSLPDASLNQHGDLPGSTPKEKTRNAWAELGVENQSGLSQTANAVETPSSMGDIEASVPVSVPETIAPLSVRADASSFAHPHIAVHHGHSEPLLPPSELAHVGHMSQPSLQTIHPSALTVTGMDEVSPGSVHLGPSEFAVTLPMDSRVKDDYERVLSDAAVCIRQFFDSFQPNTHISELEVTGDCALIMIQKANIVRTARRFALKYTTDHRTVEQCCDTPGLEHLRTPKRPRSRPCKRGSLG